MRIGVGPENARIGSVFWRLGVWHLDKSLGTAKVLSGFREELYLGNYLANLPEGSRAEP
jgi:hypothetical protein